MLRYFDEHVKRCVLPLDGTWRFAIDREDVGEAEGWYRGPLCGESVTVPSVWNTDIAHLTYEGVGWYQKTFTSDEGALALSFGAVMTYARVYLDGEFLGEHYGGFCRFELIRDFVRAGEHTVTVRVDNRFDKQSIPQTRVDWYHYGGITRSVDAHLLRGICVLHNRLDYTLSEDRSTANGRFTLSLYNAEAKALTDTVRCFLNDACVATVTVTLAPYERTTVTTEPFVLQDVSLWSPEQPTLYAIRIETATDDLYDRTGFRHVEVKGGRILLNGRDTELYGANRHEDHPDFGMAFPPALMKRDIDIALRMGCNSLRGSHYPNHPTFLDMLDERGVLFWSEIPIWGCGFAPETLADPVVLERGLAMHREMVREYFNHPSIILWGMHNEIANETQQAYDMTRLYYDYLKAEGGNRLVTYASREPLFDICFELCDVICVNRYHGWYLGEIEAWDDYLRAFAERKQALGLADKPVIMSEFGAAAIYGHHSFDDVRWTEEYQARLMDYCIRHFFAEPDYVGTFIWQFTDMRTSPDMGTDRARGFNNKGVLNEYRKPKLAFHAVQAAYEAQKSTHASRFGK